MHELLTLLFYAPEQSPSSGSNNRDVIIAVVGVVGTVVVTGITAFIASLRKGKTPDLTIESIEQRNNLRHEGQLLAQIQDLREDLDLSNYEKDNYASMYRKLREAVWSKGMNPDALMRDIQ